MKDREITVDNGKVVVFGNIMRPPLRIIQRKDRILVDSFEVYPIPAALPTASDGEYPELQKLLQKVEKELATLEQPSYEEKAKRVSRYCKAAGYLPKITKIYGDIVVELKPGLGRILLINDEALAATRGIPEPTLGGEDKTVDVFFDALIEQLQLGCTVLFGRGFISAVPNNFTGKTIEMLEKIAHRGKAPKMMSAEMVAWMTDIEVTKAIFQAELAEPYPSDKLAVITFHSDIWDTFLRMPPPTHPFLLAIREYPRLGLVTTMLDDCAITVSAWDSWLRKGTKLYYNMSHGDILDDEVVIKVGNDRWGKPTHYFSASHIKSLQLELPKSLIYNYSCHSLENLSMAEAFIASGASVYLGWTAPASALPSSIDKVEEKIWSALIKCNKNITETIDLIHCQSIVPMDVNGIMTDFRFHGDGNTCLDAGKTH